jgi:HPt (histidine-containing phosphotransfer) domain-containing protein
LNNPVSPEETFVDSLTLNHWKSLNTQQNAGGWLELRDYFLEHSAQLLQEIGLVCTLNDNTELEKLAHQLKGTAVSFGTPQLAKLSELVQAQCECQLHNKMLILGHVIN